MSAIDHALDWLLVAIAIPVLAVISALLGIIVLVATYLRPPKRWQRMRLPDRF